MSTAMQAFPLRVEAQLDAPSRWLWLIKWLLAIPHFVVLAFLWMAFVVLSVVAFFSILFTAHYPHAIFSFNVGVIRWSWRVAYYSYSTLGTDRYPPFTLEEVADYPTHLEISYPERLSRGLVLVKWLLGIPHYLIVALLAGGTWFAWEESGARIGFSGLIGVLVLVAGVMLLFTGRYPQQLFDLILGFNRWVLRVAAYGALMTDTYPPFRLDQGGSETGGSLVVTTPQAPAAAATAPSGWTGGRITSLVVGAVMALVAFPIMGGGIAGTVVDRGVRGADGFVTFADETFVTSGYAVTSEGVDVRFEEGARVFVDTFVGDTRIDVTASDPSQRIFVGIAELSQVERYLGGVERAHVSGIGRGSDLRTIAGGAPDTGPTRQTFWRTSAVGRGEASVEVQFEEGTWSIVVMNADARRGVNVDTEVAATFPNLGWMAATALAFGGAMLAIGMVLMVAAARRAMKPQIQPLTEGMS